MGIRAAHWDDWSLEELQAQKVAQGGTVSLVVPARNEAATVGAVVQRVRDALVDTVALLDEIVVIDSDSEDDTYAVAESAGARVHRSAEIRPDLGSHPGKGEAMWKSLFVTTGDLVVFMDADLHDWDTHFVPGLLGPLLHDPAVQLVKGFYERPGAEGPLDGGRVTELVARPLIALLFPELGALVQPLAGEWAVRRSWLAGLSVPTGYAVELAALVDTLRAAGPAGIAQVDLGVRAHRHQALRDLGGMATQIIAAALARAGVVATHQPEMLGSGVDPDECGWGAGAGGGAAYQPEMLGAGVDSDECGWGAGAGGGAAHQPEMLGSRVDPDSSGWGVGNRSGGAGGQAVLRQYLRGLEPLERVVPLVERPPAEAYL